MNSSLRATFSVANFNIHAGVDGWGIPYDIESAIKAIDADVVVLCEAFSPDGEESLIQRLAGKFGYVVHEFPIARSRVIRLREAGPKSGKWGPYLGRPRTRQAFAAMPEGISTVPSLRSGRSVVYGQWNLAVLTRIPVNDVQMIKLLDIRQEHSHRKAAFLQIDLDGQPFVVIATHLGHILHGSSRQMRALKKQLPEASMPAVLLGDMNCWGPPLQFIFRPWRRALKGHTWPAWRPHSQLDHLLIHGPVQVCESAVLENFGSDHRPVRAVLQRDQ